MRQHPASRLIKTHSRPRIAAIASSLIHFTPSVYTEHNMHVDYMHWRHYRRAQRLREFMIRYEVKDCFTCANKQLGLRHETTNKNSTNNGKKLKQKTISIRNVSGQEYIESDKLHCEPKI